MYTNLVKTSRLMSKTVSKTIGVYFPDRYYYTVFNRYKDFECTLFYYICFNKQYYNEFKICFQ